MNTKNTIVQELESIGCKAITQIPMPYTVPTHYFTHQLNIVLEKAVLGIEKNNMPYTIDRHYFTNLSIVILQKIKAEQQNNTELAAIAPTLASLSKANVYHVPNNYFSNIVPPTIDATATAKVVEFKKWNIGKWLAAASIITIMAIGGVLFLQKPTEEVNVPMALQQVTEDDMIQYLHTEHAVLANEVNVLDDIENSDKQKSNLHNLTEDDLNNYLNTDGEKNTDKTSG